MISSARLHILLIIALCCALHPSFADEARPEMVLQIGHRGQVAFLAYSSDGETMASAANGTDEGFGEVKLWDVRTRQLKADLPEVLPDINALDFSPAGQMLTANWGEVQLWDVGTGRLQKTLPAPKDGANGTIFLDEQTLVSVDSRGAVFLWSAQSGQIERVLPGESEPGDTELAPRPVLVLSRNRQTLAHITPTKIRVWNASDWNLARTLEFPNANVGAAALSSDGRTVIASLTQAESSVGFYDVATGRLKRQWDTNGQATSLALAPDSRTLIGSVFGGGGMGLVRWWRTDNGREIRTQKAAEYGVDRVALSPNGATLATGAGLWEAGVVFWHAGTGQRLSEPVAVSDGIAALAFAPGGPLLGVAQDDNSVRLWNTETGELARTIRDEDGEVGDVNALAFSPYGSTLATGGGRNFWLHLWNWQTGKRAQSLDYKRDLPYALAFSPDGALLAAAGSDATTRVWNSQTGALLHTLIGKPQTTTQGATTFSHDGKLLVSGGGAAIYGWDARTGERRFAIERSSVDNLQFSRDDALLAASDWSDGLGVFDGATRQILWEKQGVLDFAWTPDGQGLWCRNGDGSLSRHAARTGQTLQRWQTGVGNERFSAITDDTTAWLIVSPDGQRLWGKSDAETVNGWDAASGRLLLTFRTLPTPLGVNAGDWIAYTPEGYYTGSPNCEQWIRWRVGGKLHSAAQFAAQFRRPDLVKAAL